MAAELNPDWLSRLPALWSYGVTRDGRLFFINEEAKSTTWLHPVTGEAVITGHRKTSGEGFVVWRFLIWWKPVPEKREEKRNQCSCRTAAVVERDANDVIALASRSCLVAVCSSPE
ncbi:hypothetical protein DNTS_011392 [Danionella cerebrum]|uniref:WW domain-containing protein n=1 Tax=Danionella cerebrum TaxID=2873325 RepID=A0A553PZ95_9TELE|nr:hypothetical protein DNTS_011392 [Danionella translucida]